MLPFQQFFRTQAASGSVLLIAALVALAAANSPWAAAFEQLWNVPVAISIGGHELALTAREWINDGLMSLFFLLVGLEIKREFLAGELASPRLAVLPIAGAVGGMIVPALIFWLFTYGTAAVAGWAIPMATDIAFALGVLALVAPQAPNAVRVFLSALAIVDDLGAVLVIALFYSHRFSLGALGGVVVIVTMLFGLNRIGIRHVSWYLALGLPLWWFVHESGVHATIAGVLLALCIPARSRINAVQFSREARAHLDEFDRAETGDYVVLTSKGQREAIFGLKRTSQAATEPLLRLEHALHRAAAFGIMPVFALANAGVTLTAYPSEPSLMAGAFLGLTVGKPLGIILAVSLVVWAGLASFPPTIRWRALYACGFLAGIGFTMSIFVATLAFAGTPMLETAKSSVMAGSLVAGIVAAILLRRGSLVSGDNEVGGNTNR